MISKKNTITTGFLFSSALFLGACGNEDEVTKPITEEAIDYEGVVDANPGGGLEDENIGGEVFGFTDFEVEVDYTDQDDALQASYEEDRDLVEAEYEDKISNEVLAGNDAFDKIGPLLAQLELTPDMADDEVISKVVEVFSIEPDYESINIEVTYSDGTDKEYEASGS
ncbi:YusW family protein [Planococcus sp. ISL-110]|uniref:YusW family protein n=1 Tax=Planococcus sp. ISL-110 TaxID=2819167 RepID=UPI002035013F|nr:YusW family protein [Planococcus sp. ISL-110]